MAQEQNNYIMFSVPEIKTTENIPKIKQTEEHLPNMVSPPNTPILVESSSENVMNDHLDIKL